MVVPRVIHKRPKRIFVVGDIHGCLDELRLMLEFLEIERNLSKSDLVVFVGDYIDRGPNSRGVIQYLMDFKERFPDTVFLKGNHEDMMLSYLTGTGPLVIQDSYLANGGIKTLESYQALHDEFALPEEEKYKLLEAHMNFFYGLELCVEIGKFIIVHAGLNPLRDKSAQLEEDLLWIRNDFINNPHSFGKTVVFGHTPFNDVFFDWPYKIGIDTGLVYGNRLTCIELKKKEIFQIFNGEADIIVESCASKMPEEKPKKKLKRPRKKIKKAHI